MNMLFYSLSVNYLPEKIVTRYLYSVHIQYTCWVDNGLDLVGFIYGIIKKIKQNLFVFFEVGIEIL